MKKNLKPYVYKQIEFYVFGQDDIVLFVERSGELLYVARLSTKRYGAEGKPSLKWAK